MQRDDYLNLAAALLSCDCDLTVAHMLTPDPHRVATAQSGVRQYVKPYAFFGANWPSVAVTFNVLLGPHRYAVIGLKLRILHGRRWINPDEAGFFGPRIEAAHRVEEVPRLEWCLTAPIPTGRNVGLPNGREGLSAGRLDNLTEDSLTPASRCW